MKSQLLRLVIIAYLLVILTPSYSRSVQERRTALVIGNGAYKSSPLVNPVNDATDIASALKKLGFSVQLKINANQKSMENAIRSFGKDLRSGGVGLFYFAGHGIQVNGRNYLIPIGADIESEADVKYESVDAGRVLSQMYEAQNGLNIIILDACRDNPFARSFRSSEKGLAKMDAPTGSILAYSTAPGSVAADGTGRNGLYTSMLLKHMKEPNLPIERVFKEVRIEVMNESSGRQVPWESSSLTGDFYFNTKRGIAVKERPTVESKKLTKKTQEYSSISPKITEPKEIESDGRFIAYDNETVKDTKTGLIWAAKDNGKDISWKEAKRYCENYRGGGYADWRMPTIEELQGLYDKSESYQPKGLTYPVYLTKLIQLTVCCIWASDIRDSEAALFTMTSGVRRWGKRYRSKYARALPVRANKLSDSRVLARDGNFIAYANGIVYDDKTGLEWYAGPDKDITWNEAYRWVEILNVDGGGWRMPTRKEIKTLYKRGRGTRNMTPLMKNTGWYVWSGERESNMAWFFGFNHGGYEGTENWSVNYNISGRVFAVRPRR